MATLISENLALEVNLTREEPDWIRYWFRFTHRNVDLINPQVMAPSYHNGKTFSPGKINTDHYELGGLLSLLKNTLDSNGGCYWEPDEPTIQLFIHPESRGSFLHTFIDYIQADDCPDCHLRVSRPYREPVPNKSNDLFTLIMFVNTNLFNGESYFSGDGLAIQMTVDRSELSRFTREFENEYKHFCSIYNINLKRTD